MRDRRRVKLRRLRMLFRNIPVRHCRFGLLTSRRLLRNQDIFSFLLPRQASAPGIGDRIRGWNSKLDVRHRLIETRHGRSEAWQTTVFFCGGRFTRTFFRTLQEGVKVKQNGIPRRKLGDFVHQLRCKVRLL